MASICPVFKWLVCLVFKWHSKTRPFGIQPLFDHLNTRLVRYSDHYCIWVILTILCSTPFRLYASISGPGTSLRTATLRRRTWRWRPPWPMSFSRTISLSRSRTISLTRSRTGSSFRFLLSGSVFRARSRPESFFRSGTSAVTWPGTTFSWGRTTSTAGFFLRPEITN